MAKLMSYLKNPGLFMAALLTSLGKNLPNEFYLKWMYRFRVGGKFDFKNPQTFNQKLQWLKLYDKNPLNAVAVDKWRVRDYVAETIGEEYLVPLYGVWERAEQIDFSKLPESFVLKCNHNSGKGVIVCPDKKKLDVPNAVQTLKKALKEDYYLRGRELAYQNVPRKILAEKYLSDHENTEVLTDYKFMCFHGSVKCVFTCTGRRTKDGLRVTFFDRDWKRMPFERRYKASETTVEMPAHFREMRALAETLAKDFTFVRVDFYEASGKVYFGELTLYPGNGFEPFRPKEWDKAFGEYLDLSGL